VQENKFKPSIDWQIFWTLLAVAVVVSIVGVALSHSGVKLLKQVGQGM